MYRAYRRPIDPFRAEIEEDDRRRGPATMTFRPFIFKHVPGSGDAESSLQPRYVVEDKGSGDFVRAYFSGGAAAEEADRLCIAAGACPTCAGRGRLAPDVGDSTLAPWQACERCEGSGLSDPGRA